MAHFDASLFVRWPNTPIFMDPEATSFITRRRAILYARVSGDDRRNESRNVQGQLDMCRAYAERQGYEVIAELAEDDRGASGAAFELPQLSEVRRLAESHNFDVLVVREIDRLSRNLVKQLVVEEEMRRAGVCIEYVVGEYPDTAEGRLNKHIKATISEYEREKISERMMRGRRLKVAAGNVHVHGRTPFGYRLIRENKKETLEIEESEARVIRQIFSWYTVGDQQHGPYSLRAIRKLLDELGIPTPADRGKGISKKREFGKWAVASVAYILNCETYAGTWRYAKTSKSSGTRDWRRWTDQEGAPELSVAVPAIIDSDTWELARQRLLANRRERVGNVQWPYLLRRRLRCGQCGATVASTYGGRPGHNYGYYRCARAAGNGNYDDRSCATLSVNASAVDESVWNWLRDLLLDEETLAKGLLAIQTSQVEMLRPVRDRLAVVECDLTTNRDQLGRLTDLYLAGTLPRDLLDERAVRLHAQAQMLIKERTDLHARLQAPNMSDERIADIRGFAAAIAQRLLQSDDFETRSFVVEALDVRGILTTTPDQRLIEIHCELGQKNLVLLSRLTRTSARRAACRRARRGSPAPAGCPGSAMPARAIG